MLEKSIYHTKLRQQFCSMFGAIFGHLSAVYQNQFEGEDEKAKVALYDPSGHKCSIYENTSLEPPQKPNL